MNDDSPISSYGLALADAAAAIAVVSVFAA
ncbi:hypothetical protein P368_03600 [Comamonas thiooxydans]|nr:hypothetical protein P369_04395 [Comamonas thiooxydans]KGH01423.1 hypothetical protein P367_04600 [Comamonas thiooxydans]KGH07160.1 hypothetical protein P365_04605 [Comamonas thiooxydans]KGH15202.1 hypothetical protein P368_03600 [Comamonas thiooxydans]